MDNETIFCIVLLWGAISALIISFYGIAREEHKGVTYAEILLCVIGLPGLLIILATFLIAIPIRWLWEQLDRPIKEGT